MMILLNKKPVGKCRCFDVVTLFDADLVVKTGIAILTPEIMS